MIFIVMWYYHVLIFLVRVTWWFKYLRKELSIVICLFLFWDWGSDSDLNLSLIYSVSQFIHLIFQIKDDTSSCFGMMIRNILYIALYYTIVLLMLLTLKIIDCVSSDMIDILVYMTIYYSVLYIVLTLRERSLIQLNRTLNSGIVIVENDLFIYSFIHSFYELQTSQWFELLIISNLFVKFQYIYIYIYRKPLNI